MTAYVLADNGTTPPIFLDTMAAVQQIGIAIGVSSTFDGDYLIEGAIQDTRPWFQAPLTNGDFADDVTWFEIVNVTTAPASILYGPWPSVFTAIRVTVSNWAAGSLAIQVFQPGCSQTMGATAAEMLATTSA